MDTIDEKYGAELEKALSIGDKHKRGAAVAGVEKEITASFCAEGFVDVAVGGSAEEEVETKDADAPLLPPDDEDELDTTNEPENDDEVTILLFICYYCQFSNIAICQYQFNTHRKWKQRRPKLNCPSRVPLHHPRAKTQLMSR